MKHYGVSSGIGLVLLIFLMAGIFHGVAVASSSPTSINLDLSQPPKPPQEEDLFTERYDEVMGEITISDEAAMVVDAIKGAVEEVKDLQMDVSITEIRGQRTEEVFLHLWASVEEMVARVEFRQPSALRGQLLVLNQETMEMRMFQPVNNQIMVQGLEDASKEALSAISIAEITSFLDFSQYHVEVLEIQEEEEVQSYLLQVEALDDQLWHVQVQSDTWVPHRITVFEADVMVGTVSLSNVVLDPGLCVEEISTLPDVKETRI